MLHSPSVLRYQLEQTIPMRGLQKFSRFVFTKQVMRGSECFSGTLHFDYSFLVALRAFGSASIWSRAWQEEAMDSWTESLVIGARDFKALRKRHV